MHGTRYSRKGSTKPTTGWLRSLQPYVDAWTTATAHVWEVDGAFELEQFHEYLQRYMASTRLYLIPPAVPEQMAAPTSWDMYPTEATAGTRHHAVSILSVSILSKDL